MRPFHSIALVVFMLCLPAYSTENIGGFKTWTDRHGRTVYAKIVLCEPKYSEPSLEDVITLERKDGSQKEFTVSELSYADQQYVIGNIKDATDEGGWFHLWGPTLRKEFQGSKPSVGDASPATDVHQGLFFPISEEEDNHITAQSVPYRLEPTQKHNGKLEFLFKKYATAVLLLAAWFAFMSIRRMSRVARGRASKEDLSLADQEAWRELDTNPAFGDPVLLALHGTFTNPASQFLKRWIIYFPLAWLTNIFNWRTWFFAFPAAILVWGVELWLANV